MITETDLQLTLRAHALSLVVATTGVTSLAATATGYTRAAGSFLADGLSPGMEITPAGFTTTTRQTITAVSALTLTASGTRTVEVAAGGRSIVATLPSRWAWEGNGFTPTAGVPWVQEQFVGGPSRQVTIGEFGDIEKRPTYVLIVHTPINTGLAARRYADAILRGFPPGLELAAPGGDELHVRAASAAPYAGRLVPTEPGFQGVVVTVPLWIQTANII